MNSDILLSMLPLLALIVAGILVAALWFWWTSDEDGHPPGRDLRHEPDVASLTAESPEPAGGISNLVGRLSSAISSGSDSTAKSSSPPGASATPPAGDAVEVLRVFRDLADGSLIVEISGVRYRRLSDITDPQIGRRFMGNAQALARFARLGDVNVPADWAEEAPSPEGAASPAPPEPAAPLSDWQTPAVTAEPATPPAPRPGVGPAPADEGGTLLGGLFGGGRQEAGEEQEGYLPPLSMAEQIEELLQQRLARTGEFAGRPIHVHTAEDGGVLIEVDGVYYEGVGDVTDEAVRRFIQETIQQWEEQQ